MVPGNGKGGLMRLIVQDRLSGEMVINRRWKKSLLASEVRAILHTMFSNVWSELEKPTLSDARFFQVYLSPNRNGVGRYGSLQLWAAKEGGIGTMIQFTSKWEATEWCKGNAIGDCCVLINDSHYRYYLRWSVSSLMF